MHSGKGDRPASEGQTKKTRTQKESTHMNIEKTLIHRGGCLCGGVRYEAAGTPVVVAHCHCEDCQRSSGAGHSTGAMFASENFHLQGKTAQYVLESSRGNQVTKLFCPVCGSSILGSNSAMAGFVTVSLGTFDDSSLLTPQVVVFARNKKPWDVMDESLPTFDTQPDWKPADGI
jgi:hypothetical protein